MTGRHVHATGQRLDVQWLGVLAVDPVPDPTQQGEVAETLFLGTVQGASTSDVESGTLQRQQVDQGVRFEVGSKA